MGLFFSGSAIAERAAPDVLSELSLYAKKHRGDLRQAAPSENSADHLICDSQCRNTIVMYPNSFCQWDEASAHLSRNLKTSVLSFHVHDGDLWMYVFFVNGRRKDAFNPVPDYWNPLTRHERSKWTGSAEILSKHWPDLELKSVQRYLVPWTETNRGSKAYKTDEATCGNPWQLVDFLRAFKLKYPVQPDGTQLGEMFSFSVAED